MENFKRIPMKIINPTSLTMNLLKKCLRQLSDDDEDLSLRGKSCLRLWQCERMSLTEVNELSSSSEDDFGDDNGIWISRTSKSSNIFRFKKWNYIKIKINCIQRSSDWLDTNLKISLVRPLQHPVNRVSNLAKFLFKLTLNLLLLMMLRKEKLHSTLMQQILSLNELKLLSEFLLLHGELLLKLKCAALLAAAAFAGWRLVLK